MVQPGLPVHGLRATYETGCRCTPCRAANARYWTAWRRARLAQRPPLGSRIPAARTHILLRVIRTEGISHRRLGREVFGSYRQYKRVRTEPVCTLRTALKVQRFYRLVVAAPEQLPIPLDHASEDRGRELENHGDGT